MSIPKKSPSPVFGMQVIVPDSESESEQDVKPSQDLLASVNNLKRRIQKQEQDAVLPDIPDIPDVKPQYMDKPESKKLSFSMEEYKDMVPTVVAEIPYDIDGTRSLQRMLLKFPATLNELKSEFEEMMLQLLTVSTISEFQELQSRLIQISALVPCIESGLKW